MHSVHHLFNLPHWYLEQPADVIHFNCGLWDCRRLSRELSDYSVPLEQYVRNLDFIIGTVREHTDAKLIWATTTPVVAERYNNAASLKAYAPQRHDNDPGIFNEALAPVLEKYGVVINDLYSLVEKQGAEQMICEDGLHYSEIGYAVLGKQVANIIRAQL